MQRSLKTCLLAVAFGISMLSLPARAQDRIPARVTGLPPGIAPPAPGETPPPYRTSALPVRRPAISIGGPYGVVIGGGYGVRFGGPNGAQFGGGEGARFGGRYGAQFGGGQGVRIGPAAHSATPAGEPTSFHGVPIVIHHPKSSGQALRIRIDDRETQILPGETVAFREGGISAQTMNANGRYGPRRWLSPGDYITRETRRGWTLDRRDAPIESTAAEETLQFPALPKRDLPDVEQIPTPAGRPASTDE